MRTIVKRAAIRAIPTPNEKAHWTPTTFQMNPIRRLAGSVAIPIKKW